MRLTCPQGGRPLFLLGCPAGQPGEWAMPLPRPPELKRASDPRFHREIGSSGALRASRLGADLIERVRLPHELRIELYGSSTSAMQVT
jgi:hypothetical protein